jgi:glucose-1-phosphate cytidylyltransferase
VRPPGRFGELEIGSECTVEKFNEKPQAAGGYINGGFMVCSRRIFDYLPENGQVMLEQEPMKRLTEEGLLGAYRHDGFWQPMDTPQEFLLLNELWNSGAAPWKVW